MTQIDNRRRTFQKNKKYKYVLAEAGFFYHEPAKQIICFQCGSYMTTHTLPLSPWSLHCIVNKDCLYLRLSKSDAFIQQRRKWYEAYTLDWRDLNRTTPPRSKLHHPCVICYERERTIVFIPCGHVLTCTPCFAQVRHCLQCHQSIDQVATIYFT